MLFLVKVCLCFDILLHYPECKCLKSWEGALQTELTLYLEHNKLTSIHVHLTRLLNYKEPGKCLNCLLKGFMLCVCDCGLHRFFFLTGFQIVQ